MILVYHDIPNERNIENKIDNFVGLFIRSFSRDHHQDHQYNHDHHHHHHNHCHKLFRFVYQKYLSPVDRDEIAQSLGLSNNQVLIIAIVVFVTIIIVLSPIVLIIIIAVIVIYQVITWFQNRRAKFKRDMEELKKEVAKKDETAQFHPCQLPLFIKGTAREGKDCRDPIIRESHFPFSSLPPSHPLFALLPPHILFPPPRIPPSDARPAISPPMRAQDVRSSQ